MKMTIKVARAGCIAALLVFPMLGLDALAQSASDGYTGSGAGDIAKNPFGLCWHTGQWSEAKAIADCDPDFVPKQAPRRVEAPVPVAAPAVIPAPAPEPKAFVAAPVAPPPAALQTAARRTESITLGADTSFDLGKSDLKAEGVKKLDDLAVKLKTIQFEKVLITGHTDSIGGDLPNQKLSLKRAQAVKAYLVARGVEAKKVQTAGLGKKKPIADNKTGLGRAKNRRVEVEIRGNRML
jgi:OmpA-OmpF porin, OOP family